MASAKPLTVTEAMRPSYNTFQQAAAEGVSVFGANGRWRPVQLLADLTNGTQTEYNEAEASALADGPKRRFNVAVGGTDFEDVSITPTRGNPPEPYWESDEYLVYGSALQYVRGNTLGRFCANVLISEIAHSTFHNLWQQRYLQHQSFQRH